MGLMMPPRARGAQRGEGGSSATSWVDCGVGAIARASPQTAVAALGGLGSASGGKSGAPASARCGRLLEVRRSGRHCVRAAVVLGPGRRLILPFERIPRNLTERLLAFRPLAWCRSTPPSSSASETGAGEQVANVCDPRTVCAY